MGEVARGVMLQEQDARLILHVLAAFERLLRQGQLTVDQQRLLSPDPTAEPDKDADWILAELVVDAGAPIRRQL